MLVQPGIVLNRGKSLPVQAGGALDDGSRRRCGWERKVKAAGVVFEALRRKTLSSSAQDMAMFLTAVAQVSMV